MRDISNLDQHPETRKTRFPANLWPSVTADATTVDEWWILLEFLYSAGFTSEVAPIKLDPPSPDFHCIVAGRSRLFELGEIVNSSLAEGLAYSKSEAKRKLRAVSKGNDSEAESIDTAGRRSFSANGSLERILGKKLKKGYECRGEPCDLLLFFDRQAPYGPFEYLLERRAELASAIAVSSFENIWLFHLPDAKVMGRVSVGATGSLQVSFDHTFRFDKRAPFLTLVPGQGDEPDRMQLFEPVLSPVRPPKK